MKEHLVMKRRSSDQIEKKVIDAILNGDYPIGSHLPSERELAKAYGVGRPTVREALQRLGREGWLDIRHGQSTQVKNYWNVGNLTTLVNIIQNLKVVPDEFVIHLLELRSALAPAYSRDAVMSSGKGSGFACRYGSTGGYTGRILQVRLGTPTRSR